MISERTDVILRSFLFYTKLFTPVTPDYDEGIETARFLCYTRMQRHLWYKGMFEFHVFSNRKGSYEEVQL